MLRRGAGAFTRGSVFLLNTRFLSLLRLSPSTPTAGVPLRLPLLSSHRLRIPSHVLFCSYGVDRLGTVSCLSTHPPSSALLLFCCLTVVPCRALPMSSPSPSSRCQTAITSMFGFMIIVDFVFMNGGNSFVYDPDYKVCSARGGICFCLFVSFAVAMVKP
jgi:hypothetical protein